MMTQRLQRDGYVLRAPEPGDLECMFRFENSADLWELSNTTGPYSHYQLKQYIEQSQNDLFMDRQLRLMIETPGKEVAGIVDICNFDPLHSRAEVGIVVGKEYRKRGVARLALALLEEHCFYYLGIHQLFAYIDTDNLACRALFASCGYRECALLGDWMHACGGYRDVVMVQKVNSL